MYDTVCWALTGHILVSIRILGLPSADRMVHRLFPRGEWARQVFPDALLSLAGEPQVGNVGEKGDLEDDLGRRFRDGGVIKDGTFPRGLGSKVGWVEERMGENFGDLQESDYNRPPSSDSLPFVDFHKKTHGISPKRISTQHLPDQLSCRARLSRHPELDLPLENPILDHLVRIIGSIPDERVMVREPFVQEDAASVDVRGGTIVRSVLCG